LLQKYSFFRDFQLEATFHLLKMKPCQNS